MADADDEHQLLESARRGNTEAFETLVRMHQERVYALIRRQVRDEGLAADLTQEVFLSAWRKIESYDGRAKFTTWLHRVAMNAVISHHRHTTAEKRGGASSPISFSADEVVEPGADFRRGRSVADQPDHHAEVSELHGHVLAAIDELEPEFSQAVMLRDVEGKSYEEIAEVLDVSVGTVRSRIHRARAKLRARLSGLLDSDESTAEEEDA